MKWCLVYIDMDGTICGETDWKGFWWNILQLYKGIKYRPPEDLKWTLLTSRPKIDLPIIKSVCLKYNLRPEKIITAPTWLYKFEDLQQVANWKYSIMSKDLSDSMVDEAIYIDDDSELMVKIPRRNGLKICSTNAAKQILESLRGNARWENP